MGADAAKLNMLEPMSIEQSAPFLLFTSHNVVEIDIFFIGRGRLYHPLGHINKLMSFLTREEQNVMAEGLIYCRATQERKSKSVCTDAVTVHNQNILQAGTVVISVNEVIF